MAGARTGHDWLDLLLEKLGRAHFELAWLLFVIGQAGALLETDPERAAKMLDLMEGDAADLRQAFAQIDEVVADIIANGRRNLGAPA